MSNQQYYKRMMALDAFERAVPSLIQDGVIWLKPKTTGTTERELLPKGDYPFVVTKWAEEELPEWKRQGAIDWYNKNEQERADKNPDYTPKTIESFDELPWFKRGEYVFYLKVREGEHAGKSLPCVYLPLRWNTDPKYRDRSKWFLFCKTIVPDRLVTGVARFPGSAAQSVADALAARLAAAGRQETANVVSSVGRRASVVGPAQALEAVPRYAGAGLTCPATPIVADGRWSRCGPVAPGSCCAHRTG